MKNAEIRPAHESLLIQQDWSRYTPSDHEVWSMLYGRRVRHLELAGSAVFLRGIRRIGLRRDQIPALASINRRLQMTTGWEAVAVSGFLPAADFFSLLSLRRFPTTISIRKKDQIDYVPEPDIFHDVFGHVPLHADLIFANFLQRFGFVASHARSQDEIDRLTRFFWFTVEFGLIREAGEVKVYGSGLISSEADSHNALGPACERRAFSLDAVMAQSFEIDHLQNVLFVIDSFEQLYEALGRISVN